MVFADSREYWNKMPPGAKQVKKDAGNIIPIALVTTADAEQGIMGISYNALKGDMRGSVRDLRDKLETVDVTGGSGMEERKEEELAKKSGSTLLAESQTWTNNQGVQITAAIRQVEGDQVEFLMPNGQAVPYPLANLSSESRQKIASLQKPGE